MSNRGVIVAEGHRETTAAVSVRTYRTKGTHRRKLRDLRKESAESVLTLSM